MDDDANFSANFSDGRAEDADDGLEGEPEPDGDETSEEPFERPIDRFRKGAIGSVVAAGLLGIGDALEGRAPKEEVTIVQEAPSQPHRGFDLVLDPEHPERSVVYLPTPDPTPDTESDLESDQESDPHTGDDD